MMPLFTPLWTTQEQIDDIAYNALLAKGMQELRFTRVPYGYITVKSFRRGAISPITWYPYGRKGGE